jgi:hypothetical protein
VITVLHSKTSIHVQICALLRYYVASCGKSAEVSGQPFGPGEEGTDWLSRHVGTELPLYAA